jgi:hypothetical protein
MIAIIIFKSTKNFLSFAALSRTKVVYFAIKVKGLSKNLKGEFMKNLFRKAFFCFVLLALSLGSQSFADAQTNKNASGINVPVTYYKLPNGLKVVLSQEKSKRRLPSRLKLISDKFVSDF